MLANYGADLSATHAPSGEMALTLAHDEAVAELWSGWARIPGLHTAAAPHRSLLAVRSAETTRCLLQLGASALLVSVRGETARDQFWDNSLCDIYFGYTVNFPTACTRERIIVQRLVEPSLALKSIEHTAG